MMMVTRMHAPRQPESLAFGSNNNQATGAWAS